uniref:Phosphoglycolate phosphatase n=1 Tax=Candidatus Kentrum sp. FW TaxID=2126338 RepID=A0A450TVU9_9GAMM|nr:MAG: phosphoglycolate phosphatase [Candidatus Kentron sp. FW]
MEKIATHRGCTQYSPSEFHTILFDLDGTLADTAPDLLFALNQVVREEGLAPLSLEEIRPFITHGGRAMVQRALGVKPENPSFTGLLERFLNVYRDNVATYTRLFPGMEKVLTQIEENAMRWGIVTNKSSYLTKPLTVALGLNHRATCIVSGDTTVHRKPYPDPLLLACKQTGTIPAYCLYIGDAAKDIEAGLRAGTHTAVALFGYISPGEAPEAWGANCLLSSPQDLFDWLANSS